MFLIPNPLASSCDTRQDLTDCFRPRLLCIKLRLLHTAILMLVATMLSRDQLSNTVSKGIKCGTDGEDCTDDCTRLDCPRRPLVCT